MRFSIVTPCFRGGRWLKLCLASVADQGVDLEHIIQDARSDDGTLDWLLKDTRAKVFVEPDNGMYDAVNRGFRRATGDILAYLNCDEQYLPGALAGVGEYFAANPDVEVVFAGAVIVDAEGRYVCHRHALPPGRLHSQISGNLSFLTCATFFRRSIIEQRGLFFDPKYRDVGDAEWALRLLDAGVRMGVLRRFTTAFADTGKNMSLGENAQRERRQLAEGAPAVARAMKWAVILAYRMRKLAAGLYFQEPFDYAIYTHASPDKRVTFHVARPTARWRR